MPIRSLVVRGSSTEFDRGGFCFHAASRLPVDGLAANTGEPRTCASGRKRQRSRLAGSLARCGAGRASSKRSGMFPDLLGALARLPESGQSKAAAPLLQSQVRGSLDTAGPQTAGPAQIQHCCAGSPNGDDAEVRPRQQPPLLGDRRGSRPRVTADYRFHPIVSRESASSRCPLVARCGTDHVHSVETSFVSASGRAAARGSAARRRPQAAPPARR